MTSTFLNPKNDAAFKRIFGTEKNKDILLHFLNDILERASNPIEKISFLPTVQDPKTATLRSSTVDVMCKDKAGHQFIVEMQANGQPGFEKRAQYYAAKAYVQQSKKGNPYANLKEIIFIAITNFTLFPEKEAYLSHHIILDKETKAHNLRDFWFTFLELPKFKKKKNQLQTIIEKWAYFFKKAQQTELKDLATIVGSDSIIQRAFEELDQYGWTDAEIRQYESIEMKQWDEQAMLAKAKIEGKIEGKTDILSHQIRRRFNISEIDTIYQHYLNHATNEQLTVLADRIFEAKTLAELFEED